jgi:hypothetical protein
MTGPSPTRRTFLLAAGVGATALAGCGEIGSRSGRDTDPIPVGRLPDVPGAGESKPAVEDAVPVDIERERLGRTAARVTDLLATLPTPFGPSDVPNGSIRHELLEASEAATDHLDDARSATTRLSAMLSLRRARAEARYAAEGWAFVEDGRAETALREERRATASEAETFRSTHEYLGDDPVRAAVAHAHIERTLRRIIEDRTPAIGGRPGALLTVARWGEHAESGRAALDDSRYLYDRFETALPPNAGTVTATLGAAAESLTADLGRRREALPPEPTEAGGDPVDRLRHRLRRDAESSAENASGGAPAETVVDAVAGITAFLAHDRVLRRIEDGERFRATSGSDVRTVRSEAVSAIRTALEESPEPALARGVLADAAVLVTHADDELARYRRSVRAARLDAPVRRYVAATVRARSAPAACRQVADAFET